jgi:internalin A
MYCSKCGSNNVEEAKYCNKCSETLENKKPVNNEIDVVNAKETVVGFNETAVNKRKTNMNSLKDKFKTLSKKQTRITISVVSIILVACVVGVIIYKNTPKQKTESVRNKVKESTVITFTDKNLEQVIRAEIKKPTGDILKGDVDKITSLLARKMNIINLLGIENLSNLNKLNLAENQISNIEPLKGLINLNTLLLIDNQISNIEPLKGLTNLNDLQLSDNQISNIKPLKGLTNLINLGLDGNQISNIEPLKGLTNLNDLHLLGNQISNIESLKELTNLNSLSLPGNQTSDIEPLKGLTNLNSLFLSENQISNIEPLKGLTNLTNLSLDGNQISNIESLKGLTNLTNLWLYSNPIKDYTPVNSYYNNLRTKDFTLEDKGDTGYIFPNSSTEKLNVSDLDSFTERELMLARNEIYARHGLAFNTDNIKSYFESKSWYQVNSSYKGDINSIEDFNVKLIKKIEEGNADNIESATGLTKQDVIIIMLNKVKVKSTYSLDPNRIYLTDIFGKQYYTVSPRMSAEDGEGDWEYAIDQATGNVFIHSSRGTLEPYEFK